MNKEPFEEVVEANKQSIFRICKIYATPPYEPEDFFQEVVFQGWKSYDRFEGKSKASTWIYRVALNVCLQLKSKHSKANDLTSRIDSIQVVLNEDTSSEDQERFEWLKACIQQLGEADRSIIVLFLEELPYKEIGAVLGLTENHVAVKMKRIKAKLAECMTPKMQGHA
ncbi:sigma-70 family RNA polymerase sigma factor [Marinoscillum sp.]|uniref:sigma-70 family RNA polymerase sigma factor n=1 Tax=Marinoscillum sp. TaxID=2024838 RepID=UPI003BAD511B